MVFLNSQSFDITKLVKQYQGKTLEDLYQEHYQIVKNSMGEFMELIWREDMFPCELNLSITRKKLLRNLKTVHYIGDFIENKLKGRGIQTLSDLRFLNLRYQESANSILSLIKGKDYVNLTKNKYIDDLDVSFCFKVEELLFLDIETLGLYNNAMIIVGLGFYKNNIYEIHLLFARNLEEEIAICEHLKKEIISNFKCLVSYNGKRFDIPYLANRFLYYFDKNPMIFETDTPYEVSNSKFHHIDLYQICRRRFKGIFDRYTLTNIEEQLLNMKRGNELPSSMVPLCYKKYQKNPKRYTGLVKECIEHNYFDVYSMPLILQKLLDS
ncbi:MAG: ribonuclease H-like domain-containing protein [Candidatus Heimdallarchaeota archaeon]